MSRQRSRKTNNRSKRQQKLYRTAGVYNGGFIRDNVPQFSEFCGTNPLYDPLPNPETCTSCSPTLTAQNGGKRKQQQKRQSKRRQSRNKSARQQRGGFIRDNVPQFSEFCGTNPLYDPLPNPETCTSCSAQQGGNRKQNKSRSKKNNQLQYWF